MADDAVPEAEIDEPESKTPSVSMSLEKFVEAKVDRRLEHHVRDCPAARAYQRVVGVVAAGLVLVGVIIWLGQNATENRITKAVDAAITRRLPILRAQVREWTREEATTSWSPPLVSPAVAAPRQQERE